MGFTTWHVDREAGEYVGPCGCRVSMTLDGLLSLQGHECPTAEPLTPKE